ncbi:hypothetical protein M514_02046 [Trichuris suis]|uniref:Uncharacterized protein n=1 Tax=Trichuris suis TaxID=68888 RepID=A0A085N2B2_9BILA|nr:hypothetical protein M513_02046 [Trichuris suis]KFD63608.1 hypothetical protein M514_02046 [Trichuris suis]
MVYLEHKYNMNNKAFKNKRFPSSSVQVHSRKMIKALAGKGSSLMDSVKKGRSGLTIEGRNSVTVPPVRRFESQDCIPTGDRLGDKPTTNLTQIHRNLD